ncbi:MAG TPA: M48 family metalloprotease [Candidatus Tyrphobacter sp.]
MRCTRPFDAIALALFVALSTAPAIADQHADDVALGRQVYQNLESKNQIVDASPYNAVLQRVGARIARAAQPHWFTEQFFIIRGNQMNAFSAPGGYVFVNEGLLRAVDDEDELANVLGHETAHLVLGHVFARNQQQNQRSTLYRIGGFLANSGIGGSNAQTAYNAGVAAGNYTFLSFTRQQEYAADQLGVTLAADAGYNPWGSIWFFAEADRLEGDAGYEPLVQQHPSTSDRVARIKAYLQGNPATFGRWSDVEPPGIGLPMTPS